MRDGQLTRPRGRQGWLDDIAGGRQASERRLRRAGSRLAGRAFRDKICVDIDGWLKEL